ncbi:hypothetical protein Pfo_012694, partial [Paulownia fortunei]
MGGCTIAMMDWHHTHTSPSTPQATSAEEHLRLSIGTSMKEPSLLVLAALWELGTSKFSPSFFNCYCVCVCGGEGGCLDFLTILLQIVMVGIPFCCSLHFHSLGNKNGF